MSTKVFYTASFYGKAKYQKNYDMVLKALKQNDIELVSTEEGTYKKFSKEHYQAIKKGILWAEGVVIEISNEDFQLGHEATLAIQNKKHVLCLSVHEDFSKKIKNRYFHGAKYNQFNIEELVEEFLKFVAGEKLDKRFNLFLSESQLEYIEKVATESGVNKSEYIRGLIDRDKKN